MRVIFFFLLLSANVKAQDNFLEAKRLYESGYSAQAKPLFEAYLKANPNHLSSLVFLGDIAAAGQKWSTALGYFKQAVQLKPQVADYHYKYGGAMGMVAKEANKFKALAMIPDVRRAFEKALLLNPKHIGAHWALIELNIQLPAIAGGSTKRAYEYADKLYKISAVDGYLAKGHIAESDDQFKQAEQYYKNAVTVGQSKTAYEKLANLYKKNNQPEKARATMATYQKINKS